MNFAEFSLSHTETFLFLSYQLLTNMVNILIMVFASTYVTLTAKQTGSIAHKIIVTTKNQTLRQRVNNNNDVALTWLTNIC